mmetsp:Transcript_1942/g.3495  ORF Transcript_1942/g.3495 Transcript_1942/m.3495 type:complete len:206 (-) Transcript_1942:3662-4279(-)
MSCFPHIPAGTNRPELFGDDWAAGFVRMKSKWELSIPSAPFWVKARDKGAAHAERRFMKLLCSTAVPASETRSIRTSSTPNESSRGGMGDTSENPLGLLCCSARSLRRAAAEVAPGLPSTSEGPSPNEKLESPLSSVTPRSDPDGILFGSPGARGMPGLEAPSEPSRLFVSSSVAAAADSDSARTFFPRKDFHSWLLADWLDCFS